MSEKRKNFERLAEKRVTEAIRVMRLIGNLSNKRNYDYDESHAKQIIEALDSELRLLKNRFKDGAQEELVAFSFKKN